MLGMNYDEANKFFKTASDVDKMQFFSQIPNCQVMDVRGKNARGIIDVMVQRKSFILIDGVSGVGKTTLANLIKKRYGNLVEVLDIDILCKEYLEKQQKKMSKTEFMIFLFNYEAETDKFISKELENIVIKASAGGRKAVILVGTYLFLIARAVITYMLGVKHFPYTASITLHENLETIVKRLSERDGNFSFDRISSEFFFLETLLDESVNYLGIGANVSILANSETSWDL